MSLSFSEVKEFLNEKADQYNNPNFIESDPIQIPHQFGQKGDIEIAGFLSAILAWGQRSQIIKNSIWLMSLMYNEPYDFVVNATEKDLKRIEKFYYRTFKSVDALFFIRALKYIYIELGGLEAIFTQAYKSHGDLSGGLKSLYDVFSSVTHEDRSMKHLANIRKGSSAKRINMFLRWMIRKDNRGVDFGLWQSIPSAALYIPLDIHTGTVAREIGILTRKQNDWRAVCELTDNLRLLDKNDPIKYDFALFGFGVNR